MGAGAALLLWDHPFSCLNTTRTSSFPKNYLSLMGRGKGHALAGHTMALSSHLTMALPCAAPSPTLMK